MPEWKFQFGMLSIERFVKKERKGKGRGQAVTIRKVFDRLNISTQEEQSITIQQTKSNKIIKQAKLDKRSLPLLPMRKYSAESAISLSSLSVTNAILALPRLVLRTGRKRDQRLPAYVIIKSGSFKKKFQWKDHPCDRHLAPWLRRTEVKQVPDRLWEFEWKQCRKKAAVSSH